MISSIVISLLFIWALLGIIAAFSGFESDLLTDALQACSNPYQKAFVCFLFGPLVQLGALTYFIWWLLGRLGKSD